MPKASNVEILQETLHATHLLKLLDKMYKYEMDPTRTVEATERTRDAGRTRDERGTDGRSETNIPPPPPPPQQLRCAGGIIISNDISILCLNRSQNRILRCTFYHIHNWRMDIIRADIVNHIGKAFYKLFSIPDNMISLLPRHWFPAVASQKPTLPHTRSKNYTILQQASRPASTSSLNIRYLYSENARVCAKWQGHARDCVTVLLDRRSRECNPVTPIECVSLSFRIRPCVLAFITYKCVQTELGWL